MSPRLSVYLDATRAIAALVVLLSHFAYPRFTGGDYLIIRELNLGSDAVVIFFVLSGFVIAYTAENRDRLIGPLFVLLFPERTICGQSNNMLTTW